MLDEKVTSHPNLDGFRLAVGVYEPSNCFKSSPPLLIVFTVALLGVGDAVALLRTLQMCVTLLNKSPQLKSEASWVATRGGTTIPDRAE